MFGASMSSGAICICHVSFPVLTVKSESPRKCFYHVADSSVMVVPKVRSECMVL